MSRKSGENLPAEQGPFAMAQFAATSSLVNAAAQYVPAFNGSVTVLTPEAPMLVAGMITPSALQGTGEQRVVGTMRIRFEGNAANVAGQTISVQLLKNGVPVVGSIVGMATTAGVKTGEVLFTTPIVFEPGDEALCTITPSALLTAAVTNVSIALGG